MQYILVLSSSSSNQIKFFSFNPPPPRYFIDQSQVPDYIPISVAEKILFVGKALQILKQSGNQGHDNSFLGSKMDENSTTEYPTFNFKKDSVHTENFLRLKYAKEFNLLQVMIGFLFFKNIFMTFFMHCNINEKKKRYLNKTNL